MGDNILVSARLLSRFITAIYDDRLRRFKITAAQFILLALISEGPVTRADIARQQHLERSTLTRNLKAIFSEGWVAEVRENADGRSRPIALTTAGKDLLSAAQPECLAAEAEATALLGKNEMMTVISVAKRLASPTEMISTPTAEDDLG
jgi:DNA-binding MarR family transcriptional regulator